MSNLLIQVTLDRANRKKDKAVSLTFITQLEQSSEEFMQIDSILNDSGVLYFKSNGNLTKEEIKELEGVEIEYSVKQALECEFNISELQRKVEIIKTAKALEYDELAQEMTAETEVDYNIQINLV